MPTLLLCFIFSWKLVYHIFAECFLLISEIPTMLTHPHLKVRTRTRLMKTTINAANILSINTRGKSASSTHLTQTTNWRSRKKASSTKPLTWENQYISNKQDISNLTFYFLFTDQDFDIDMVDVSTGIMNPAIQSNNFWEQPTDCLMLDKEDIMWKQYISSPGKYRLEQFLLSPTVEVDLFNFQKLIKCKWPIVILSCLSYQK